MLKLCHCQVVEEVDLEEEEVVDFPTQGWMELQGA